MEQGEGGSEEGLFQNPGNTFEVKRDIEGGWSEAITGNLRDYFRHQTKKERKEKRRKEKQERGCALKRFCRRSGLLEVNRRSSLCGKRFLVRVDKEACWNW